MKKILLILSLIFVNSFVFGQGYGYGFKDPKEAYTAMSDTEKYLLLECSKLIGVPIDSMTSIDSIYNTSEYYTSNVKVVVRSNYLFINPVTGQETDTAIETVERFGGLEKPRFIVYVWKNGNNTKVTLQMYY